ncbi:hypothetical protein QN078_25200 [Ralstonia nicotianae]|nr:MULTISPECIES: hypothetical protein [Ralstonia solanacearum species complex]AXW55678.1 hypothetical protein CJO92_24185 [Ralstonia solanacearum]MCK4135711.1 hypothetical protein [Ralstonia pseudosolanacearum]MDK1383649.1 hypothetical protein [Ralstonia pseudosolanacearum]
MEIRIEKPFFLHLDCVEIDENVPSMRMQAVIEVQLFGHILKYHCSLWFDCSVWGAFVASLDSIDMAEASLVDMGGHFVLRLSAISGKPEILWEVKKAAVSGAVATAAFRSQIDEDTLAHVRRQFTQFESWWD